MAEMAIRIRGIFNNFDCEGVEVGDSLQYSEILQLRNKETKGFCKSKKILSDGLIGELNWLQSVLVKNGAKVVYRSGIMGRE